ncbi:hypothetical protein IFM89_031653 [Coptis chinensis]|uniref:Uncharacterized protein n=1 Tax=Coptis chinensis TaxID=261450 RepID=A0A835MJT0_9MAGN|nr:hypothetical protein IFM89_031653 [Coptis chinensis]
MNSILEEQANGASGASCSGGCSRLRPPGQRFSCAEASVSSPSRYRNSLSRFRKVQPLVHQEDKNGSVIALLGEVSVLMYFAGKED